MSCEEKPGVDAYYRFLEGHEVPRSDAETAIPGAKGDLSAFAYQGRLIETKPEGGEVMIRLGPPKIRR